MKVVPVLVTAGMLVLTACGTSEAPEGVVMVEQLRSGPVELRIHASGFIRPAKATPLLVPGNNWTQRQLRWMVAEGSRVEAGELVAKFSAADSEVELRKAEVDLLRNALGRAGKTSEMEAGGTRIAADLAQVGTELGIARRYAGAELDALARNDILDAIQDEAFLSAKSSFLEWRRDQVQGRGAAELAVLDSQRATQQGTSARIEADLKSLELYAPHAGVVMLTANWAGEKPRIGGVLWAGNEMGSLPDLSDLEVEFSLSPADASGLKTGSPVLMFPLGRPDQRVESTISWVASAAQGSRDNPAKKLKLRASIPAAAVKAHGLLPGQGMQVEAYAVRVAEGLSVPNIALVSSDGLSYVLVMTANGAERRQITVGERGIARTQVLAGLSAGESIVLVPDMQGAP